MREQPEELVAFDSQPAFVAHPASAHLALVEVLGYDCAMESRAPSLDEAHHPVSARTDADEAAHRERFIAAVERGLADVEAGRVIDDDELGRELDEEFGPVV